MSATWCSMSWEAYATLCSMSTAGMLPVCRLRARLRAPSRGLVQRSDRSAALDKTVKRYAGTAIGPRAAICVLTPSQCAAKKDDTHGKADVCATRPRARLTSPASWRPCSCIAGSARYAGMLHKPQRPARPVPDGGLLWCPAPALPGATRVGWRAGGEGELAGEQSGSPRLSARHGRDDVVHDADRASCRTPACAGCKSRTLSGTRKRSCRASGYGRTAAYICACRRDLDATGLRRASGGRPPGLRVISGHRRTALSVQASLERCCCLSHSMSRWFW